MADVLLTLIVPTDIAQHVEDLLLSRPDLVRGFTTSAADGHGSVVTLSGAEELVGGHAPRMLIRTAGPEDLIRSLMAAVKDAFPRANLYYWLVPLLDRGQL
ncbi:MAG TPA: DUF3240 family protein [Rhodocyclaceae bacterium]|nr:DUF3240 family protein [Rhodocyclaceae bacterium]HMW53585.1 DUF3240 family protein [Rhodocyclaceae bacterium]